MTKKIVVSIIIPVYNAEHYLKPCLNAVLRLKGASETEIILIDDGSTDRSPYILKEYMEKDPRITVITQKNKGASASRNLGITHAKGKYICFVDADDLVLPIMLEELLGKIGDSDVCVGKKIRWNQIKQFSRTDNWDEFSGTMEELEEHFSRYRRSMRGATGRLYRRDILKKHKIFFDEKLNYAEDMHFNYEYFTHVRKVTFADKPVYIYRIHNPESLSSKNAPLFLEQWKMEIECKKMLFN
ncbi:MAG: glycosyltransferase family 2 protein [Clostridiales bacterium]|nr:glycosyltransferase family 2 protein [Clostridiales bacterium]